MLRMLRGTVGGLLWMMLGGCTARHHGEVGVKGTTTLLGGAGIAGCIHSHGRLTGARQNGEKNPGETDPQQGQTGRYRRTDDVRHDAPNLPQYGYFCSCGAFF